MPYIRDNVRRGLLTTTSQAINAGELNFELTMLVQSYITRNGLCYSTLAQVISALECAKLELYRRLAAPYEDTKCAENGDVYHHGGDVTAWPKP